MGTFIVLVLLCLFNPALSQEVRYIYDDLGRLVGVVDQQGNAAEYVYGLRQQPSAAAPSPSRPRAGPRTPP